MARGRRAAPTTPSNRIEEPTETTFGLSTEPLSHPYNPKTLLDIVEATGALSACIESLVTNTDLRGHTFPPVVDLSAADINEHIQAALDFRNGTDQADLSNDIAKALGQAVPTVEGEKRRIASQLRRERFILQSFFASCNPKETFGKIREKTRRDLEATGNAYWELIRNKSGQYQQINWVPTQTMHLCRTVPETVVVPETVMVSPVQFTQRTNYVRYRRFIQGYGAQSPVYFKEAGDPRVMSSVTGAFYDTEAALLAAEANRGGTPATEILHFSIHNSTTPYGVPRWIGELVNIYGVKSADTVNNDYFNKKTLPPFIVKITGGRVSEEDILAFSQQLEDMCQGRANYHKPLILQAQTTNMSMQGVAAPPSIDIQPLNKNAQTDGQFLQYAEACNDRIGASFRLPRLVRGDSRDMTRATANATLKFAEQQVFLPLRQSFDDIVTKVIFPNIGVVYHRFESRGPELTDPVELVQMLHKSSQSGYLVPEEARNLAEQAYGIPFREVSDGWANKPSILVQTGLSAKTHDINGDPVAAPVTPDAPTSSPAPTRADGQVVTKSWVTTEIEQRFDESFDELSGTRVEELVKALGPYFRER